MVDSIEAHDRFGSALATGDFNNDGGADLAIGTPDDVIAEIRVGSVGVLYGEGFFWHPWLPMTATGWMSVPWFGSLMVLEHPWVYHSRHGWLYLMAADPGGMWFFSLDMGAFFTSPSLYPNLYRYDDGAWFYYLRDTSNPRWFYNWSAGMWQARW